MHNAHAHTHTHTSMQTLFADDIDLFQLRSSRRFRDIPRLNHLEELLQAVPARPR